MELPNKDCTECAGFTWHHAMRPARFEGQIHHPSCPIPNGARWVAGALSNIGGRTLERPINKNLLMALGQTLQNSNPTIRAARSLVVPFDRCAFDVGMGLMSCKIDKLDFDEIRNGYASESRRLAFDLAVSFTVGMRRNHGATPLIDSDAIAGWNIVCGADGASERARVGMMKLVHENSTVRVGAKAAIAEIEGVEAPAWQRALHWLGFGH